MHWAGDFDDAVGKKEFYPDVDKRTLFQRGYISSCSGHSRGSTVDLTLARADGHELDMDAVRLFQSVVMACCGGDQRRSEGEPRFVRGRHARRGFCPYEKEWWHFTLSHEPFPDTYFDFPVK